MQFVQEPCGHLACADSCIYRGASTFIRLSAFSQSCHHILNAIVDFIICEGAAAPEDESLWSDGPKKGYVKNLGVYKSTGGASEAYGVYRRSPQDE